MIICFNKSPWPWVKHPVCDISHPSRESATAVLTICMIWIIRVSLCNWQSGTFLNSPEVELGVYEMPALTKLTHASLRGCLNDVSECAWSLCRQTQKPHTGFLSSFFPVWQLQSFDWQDCCRRSVSSLLPTDKFPFCPFRVDWSCGLGIPQFSFLLLHLLQGRWFPSLKCYRTGGCRKTVGRELQKHTNHQHQFAGRCVVLGGSGMFQWCLHLAFLFVKHHVLDCCVLLRLKCAQVFPS